MLEWVFLYHARMLSQLHFLQRTRRKWIIDRQTGFVADELREDLGDWVRRQLESNIPRHEDDAHTVITDCDLTIPDLRREWESQYAMQTSVRQCEYRLFTACSRLVHCPSPFTTRSLPVPFTAHPRPLPVHCPFPFTTRSPPVHERVFDKRITDVNYRHR
jgi:hypothetical protein